MKLFILFLCALPTLLLAQFEKITFPAADGLQVTADLYRANQDLKTPMIVLFHQASFSRGAYREIAPRLVSMGFNCLAVDQRSGNSAQGVTNETNAAARAASKPTEFLDALPDLEAAIATAKESYATGPLIIWGSSYSSSLVLKLAGEQPELATAALAFSPGEYFSSQGRDFIQTAAAGIQIPVFITSAKNESSSWQAIFNAIPSPEKTSFLPESGGKHGSSTLNSDVAEHEQYWTAVESFLAPWKPADLAIIGVQSSPLDRGQITLNFSGTTDTHYRISVSKDLKRWLDLGTVTATAEEMTMTDEAVLDRDHLFYRAQAVAAPIEPAISSLTTSGSPGSYRFNVGILSPETGWEQYADWWEVLDAQGNLLYRRVLGHPHVNEQPFIRSGGPINATAEQTLWIRAHMNRGGYGSTAFTGSVAAGFQEAELSPIFASEAAVTGALPVER